jgi:hypothetical protein
MNLKRWSTLILMLGLLLALSPLGAQADPPNGPHPHYRHPHGNAYGWHGGRHHNFDRHRKYFRRYNHRPYWHRAYAGPPAVAYVAPVTPIIGIQPCPQPQPFFSPSMSPGFHGQITF